MLGRRHKASRRRSGETRLRESQSLNRITEEDGGGTLVIANNLTVTQTVSAPKVKGFGARILQGFTMGSKRPATDEKAQHFSRKDATRTVDTDDLKLPPDYREEKENCTKLSGSKKMRMLGRYFMHKRIFIPLPGLFSRNKLYKARSCGSLSRDKVHSAPEEVLKQRAVSVIRNSVGSTGDINQNTGCNKGQDTKVLVKNVRAGLTDMCVHLGQASKCSFC